MHDVEARKPLLESLLQQGNSVLSGTSIHEHSGLEYRLQELQVRYKELKEASAEKKKKLLRAVADREAITEQLEKVTTWLNEKERSFETTEKLPLASAELVKHMEDRKVARHFSIYKCLKFHLTVFGWPLNLSGVQRINATMFHLGIYVH